MRYKQGSRAEVWAEVKAAGMAEDIAKISAAFDGDIADIAVINNGVCTYLNNKPQKYVRIVPGTQRTKAEFKAAIKRNHNPKRLKGL